MKKLILGLLLAVSSPALATNLGTINLTSGGSAYFGATETDGKFTDTLSVILPQSIVTSSVVNISLLGDNVLGDIDFDSVSFGGYSLTKVIAESASNGWTETWSTTSPLAFNPGTYQFKISGRSYGIASYSGTINTTSVPEPANWGLMVLGFSAVGAALRSNRVRVQFA